MITSKFVDSQILKLLKLQRNKKIKVFRGRKGFITQILPDELVVGDMIFLEAGMKIPADCVILKSIDLAADEYPLSDSTSPVLKNA